MMANGGGTYGRTDVWKLPPVSYRTSALWGRCPKRREKHGGRCREREGGKRKKRKKERERERQKGRTISARGSHVHFLRPTQG